MPGPKPKYPIELNQEQVEQLTHLSLSYTAPYYRVQRAKALLLAYQHPHWGNTQIGKEVGCCRQTIREWRRKWCQEGNLEDRYRSGAPRRFSSLARAQIVALACTNPAEQGKVWKRWSGEKLAQVAVEKEMVECISPSTVRCWLRKDKIKPWRYHSWQKPTDPQFVQKATAVLDLYEKAQELAAQGEMVCAADEKTSIQARKRLSHTQPAISGHPVHISDRYERKGALQLFCALAVATGMTFSLCLAKKGFADFQAFLMGLFASALCQGIRVLHLVLDNGPTHAPKQLGGWIASLSLSFEVRIYWLPKHASWLDQVEIIFSKVQRDVLTPNDFPSTLALERALMSYLEELNSHPKPIRWTYTSAKLVAKFGEPGQAQLVA
jgi:transposase